MRIFNHRNLDVTLAIISGQLRPIFFGNARGQADTGCLHRHTTSRWGNELMVLREKVFGNIYIDKMRAICLLEADYNWLNKFVFTKQMMDMKKSSIDGNR
jgi:hypothetical protein